MKKRKNTMQTMLILLAVLVIGYFVIAKVQDAQLEKKENEPGEETAYVTQLSDVTKMTYSDGETTLTFVKKDDAWHYEADDALDLEESEVESIATTLGTVAALRVLDQPDALADYGLETPVYTVELQDASGNAVTLYLGNETDSGYYATAGDKEVVYTVSSSVVNAMQWDVNELVHVEEIEETEDVAEDSAGDTEETEDTEE